MNKKLIFWSIVVALGGLLFGMDVAVISGAEQEIQKLWELSDVVHGQAIASALYGTIIGALFGGIPAEKYGRKKVLLGIGLLFLVSAVGSALASGVISFMSFRFLGGLGVGASSVVAPLFISEIAPAKNRGKLVATFQFNIVFGILLAYFSNYLMSGIGEDAWRWMLGILAFPAILFVILMSFVPESPRWLMVHKKEYQKAREILQVSDPEGVDEAIDSIHRSIDEEKQKASLSVFFKKRFTVPILLAFLIAFFNQMSGINAIIYFAPRVFELAGIGKSAAFLQSAGIGLANLVFTMLGLYLIDRLGRKKLMLIGSIGYILSLGAVAAAFHFQYLGGMIVPFLLFFFIASHAIGQGAVIWVFISEIFPNQVRSYGQSLGSSVHWIMAALVTAVFPFFANNPSIGPAKIFLFFALMMILQLLWVLFKMPETKGVPLEQLEARLLNKTKGKEKIAVDKLKSTLEIK
ncbi:MAG TPA: sugar porter family MFS transporter [Niabella sp.]|nr:sugar porter family MFS transporter [Niabella sp.]HRB34318.1 sugar porter family MFS transporter [Niabella sp.]HRB75216.1 sugar porter family MFS transporter [Niabella sp.]HRB87746.1 sugar porter family MFS transporter [Niabella sp.]HRB94570.1 sugar porter family MFS transporter [Niabella sp.]